MVCMLTIACKKSNGGTPTPPVTETPEPKFLVAKRIIVDKCVSCHSGSGPGNFADNATLTLSLKAKATR